MKLFQLHEAVPGMEVYRPKFESQITARQILEPFKVAGKCNGQPGDYLICDHDELSIIPKEVFEKEWEKM